MSAKKQTLPDYWSVYRAINFGRLSGKREYTDKKTGKKMTYEFVGNEIIAKSIFMKIFSAILWLSPVLLIFMFISSYSVYDPIVYIYAAFATIIYHFAAMYYIIRGPHITISEVKKKGFFSRK